ncbi:MAG: transcription-repair coupling factor [Acidobacteriota bacterium]
MEKRDDHIVAGLRARVAQSEGFQRALRSSLAGGVQITATSLEARALFLATLQESSARRVALIVPGDSTLQELESALRLFHPHSECVAVYPAPTLSPYQEIPPSLSVLRDEIRTLGMLLHSKVELLVVPARALFRRLPPPDQFAGRTLSFATGADLELHELLRQLLENGYTRVDLVGEVGEFAFRGGILDLFPPNSDRPVRLELFGDTVDTIRHFEVDSQRSDEQIESFAVEPAAQFPLTRPLLSSLTRRLSLDFNDTHFKRDLAEKIERISEHGSFPGMENYVPVATTTSWFPDYLRSGHGEWTFAVLDSDDALSTIDRYDELLQSEYETAAAKGKAVYRPEQILTPVSEVRSLIESSSISLSALHGIRAGHSGSHEIRLQAPAAERYVNRLTDLGNYLLTRQEQGNAQVIFVSTRGGREKVERLLGEFSVPFSDQPDHLDRQIVVTPGNIAQGFDLDEMGLSVLSEWDLFEPPTSTRVGGRKKAAEAFQTDLRDLKPGDYVVHVDHGVARYRGLLRIPFGETEREVMQLEYATGGKLLLPMENLNLIQKYSAGPDSQPKLDKLGGTAWARTKASVKKAMRDMADELLKLYATRRMVQGFAFSKDSPWQFEFEEAFEFEETEDQASAIDDVKHDMEAKKPMDRLLCGDVGYGKTEVAMRAAFKSVMDGKQVALLAPTTILAYQHYRTFLRRFASFPVSIELISRFRSPKEQKEIVKKIETGEIDILIGTHRILSRDMNFKDLGVLIIDEEQRFGVAQKEKLKQFKKSVDVLSMSATPIPRSLHMSLVGIRDISVIETPPKDRLAIQTAVVDFDDDFIREALLFEIGRGGQIFFVHNRVESIYNIKEYIEKLVPGIRVIVGHGQMEEKELERAMMSFIAREYDVLMATTIIENGIDIPAANTMLINHAERFGLSQLYQLRGRVGRSDRLAFCYLLVPSTRVLSGDARKRLGAIQEFSDLGAGFRIAARDLEIRGAGNLLGGEQSGEIAAVGFEMYAKLLDEAVREIKGEQIEEDIETSMNLGIDIYIPPQYISDENLRMIFYKKLASARDAARLEEVRQEMRDRFGAIPENVESLFDFVGLRQQAQALGVVSIVRQGTTAVIKFHPSANIDPNRLLEYLGTNPKARFSPSGALSLAIEKHGRESIAALQSLLQGISPAA